MGKRKISETSYHIQPYPHQKGIHCETGSIKNMLKFHGYEINEELIFGIGSGYDFIHFPFRLFDHCEIPIFRVISVQIFKKFSKRMQINASTRLFFNKEMSMNVLDNLLLNNIPVGLVTEVSKLPFFPLRERRFSGHHFVVIGKENDNYFISDTDPNIPDNTINIISAKDLKNARFTNDLFSPRGAHFYIKSIPKTMNVKKGIISGIKYTCYKMLDIPFPFFGVKGIFYLSKRMRKYEKIYGNKQAWENIKFQIYISEEAGSGGSGFRYMYATFLKQAATYLDDEQLLTLSVSMRNIADKWQTFALDAHRQYEGRKERNIRFLADTVFYIAQMEETFFKELRIWAKNK